MDWPGAGQPAAPDPAPEKPRVTIGDACKVFITNREAAGLAPATLRKYRTFAKQLGDYADSRGYVKLDQMTAADIDVFWANWKPGARAKGKRLRTLRVLPLLRQPQVDHRIACQLGHQAAHRIQQGCQ